MLLICLIHSSVRSLERARDTYHTYNIEKHGYVGSLEASQMRDCSSATARMQGGGEAAGTETLNPGLPGLR